MFVATLFKIVKIWTQSKCPSVAEWIKKLCYVHIMEFYSAIKSMKYRYMLCTKRNLDNIMLSQRSQIQVIIVWFYFVCFHLYELFRWDKSIETYRSVMPRAGGSGELGNWKWLPRQYVVLLWGDRNVLEPDRGGGWTTLWMY